MRSHVAATALLAPVVGDGVLLSTVISASAVMVAIIGGLLVSRLVVLVGERSALERRVAELTEVRDRCKSDSEDARAALIADEANEFIDDILDDYFEPWVDGEGASFDSLYERYAPAEATREELRPYFDAFEADVKKVREHLGSRRAAGVDALYDVVAELDDVDRVWAIGLKLQEVANALAKKEDAEARAAASLPTLLEHTVDFSKMLPPSIGSQQIRAMQSISDQNRQRDLRRSYDSAKARFETAELDLKHAREALEGASRPKGVLLPIGILAAIAGAGMMYPLLTMANLASPLSTFERNRYAIVFMLSIAAFITFLVVEIVRIKRRVDQ